MEENKRHLLSVDLLRGIAAFGIVGCHLALSPITDGGWAVRALCDMNVGLFGALSGFLMWERKAIGGTWKDYVLRRCRRLLPIYFTWTVVFLLSGLFFDMIIRHGFNPKLMRVSFWPSAIFLGGTSTHLWFLVCLLYAQIIFKPLSGKMPGWCWFILGMGLVCVAAYNMDNWTCGYLVRLLAFLVTGYGLKDIHEKWNIRYGRLPLVAISLLAVSLTVMAHYMFTSTIPGFIRDWLVAISILMLFIHIGVPMRLRRPCEFIGKTSLPVFLVHPLVAVVTGIIIRKIFSAPFGPAAVAVDWVACWLISFLIAIVLIRLPFTRWCVQ